jgi:pimeloyl-ACP methyl ester carboxylesterase
MYGTGALFADFVEALPTAVSTQVVGYPNDISLGYIELLDLVRGLVPAAEPFVIVAESFSTPLAIQFAATNPPNLKGVILSAGFATSPVRGLLRFLTPFLAPPLSCLPVNRFGGRIMLLGSTAPKPLQTRILAAIATAKPRVLMDRVRAVVACNVLDDLRGVNAPMLYMQARYDGLVNPVCLDEIQRVKPEIEVVLLDGSHMLLQRLPQQTAEIVADFLGRL